MLYFWYILNKSDLLNNICYMKINRGGDVDIQKFLEESERSTRTINLSWRNSIKKNRKLRMAKKWDPIVYKIVAWLAIAGVACIASAYQPERPTEQQIEQLLEQAERSVEQTEQQVECDILCKTSEFVTKYEGYHETAYWDVKRYSIWYGTPANWRTHITKEQALQEVKDRLFPTIRELQYHIDDENMIIALASFKYNVWSYPLGWKWYIENGHINGLKNQMRKYVYAGGKVYGGLVKRREAETNLF